MFDDILKKPKKKDKVEYVTIIDMEGNKRKVPIAVPVDEKEKPEQPKWVPF